MTGPAKTGPAKTGPAMTTGDRIVALARGWIGTPYLHQTSAKAAGCDCLGLLRGIWREAVGTEPALSPEDDHMVGKVYQRGYVFNGQLLRPARVVVKQWNG